jgi:hypothetical protein
VILFRLLVLVAVWFLGTSALSRAENSATSTTETGVAGQAQPSQPPQPLLVPDVRNLPYVFAKGVLEDAGLAWRVEGKVDGYAVNLVASQSVKPGTQLVDTGAPTIVLSLKKNPDYPEAGIPDAASPYPGTKVVLAPGDGAANGQTQASQGGTSEAPWNTASGPAATTGGTETTPAAPTDTGGSASAVGSVDLSAQTTAAGSGPGQSSTTGSSDTASTARPPAFRVPGAPDEPAGEPPLPRQAQQLAAWLARQTRMTSSASDHFSYQHAWIVTGAQFGWWRGAQALRTLIKVDQRLQQRFGVGASYLAQARAALAEVLRKSGSK